jgi:sulfatase maturation enzyme AslB (radical SAM superfamily)
VKAQNLAISIPDVGCDKNCPYCISEMTGKIEANNSLFLKNIIKARTLAISANITNVLITGKGEPMLNLPMVKTVLRTFSNFPTELQTNGRAIIKNTGLLKILSDYGLNVLAISVDDPSFITKTYTSKIVEEAKEYGMLVRFTVNISDRFEGYTYTDILHSCETVGIDQMSIREITIPTDFVKTVESEVATYWIKKHVSKDLVERIKAEMKEKINDSGRFIAALPYGAKMYDIHGISVTWFDYCVQDNTDGTDIRSLIYQEDGHLYLTWNSVASKLF